MFSLSKLGWNGKKNFKLKFIILTLKNQEYPVERFRIWDYLGDNTMASLYRHEITPHLYPER